MKKIIAFSLYGENPIYGQGAIENVRLQPDIYPGYRCRIYASQEIPASVIAQLEQMGAEVLQKTRQWMTDGMFWRFLPTAEPDVDVLLVRDADSRLTKRESLAVSEWLRSGKRFHIMRDHPQHTSLIMGGMWGCRGGMLHDLPLFLQQWQQQHQRLWQRSPKGLDQRFLNQMIYPRIRREVFIHSEHVRYYGEKVYPFPTRRTGGAFVGQPVDSAMTEKQATAKLLEETSLKTYWLPLHCYAEVAVHSAQKLLQSRLPRARGIGW